MEFYYRYWAPCGVGSTVTFGHPRGGLEVTATLLERTPEKVVLRIVSRVPGPKRRELTFHERLWSRGPQGSAASAEGDEVIDIAGEEWLSHWVERPSSGSGSLKYWIADRIPGGLARWELRKGGGELFPMTWVVTSFERK